MLGATRTSASARPSEHGVPSKGKSMSAMPVFVGIDVACAKRKRLPVCFAVLEGSRLKPITIPVELSNQIPSGLDYPFKLAGILLAKVVNRMAKRQGWTLFGLPSMLQPPQPTRSIKRVRRVAQQ